MAIRQRIDFGSAAVRADGLGLRVCSAGGWYSELEGLEFHFGVLAHDADVAGEFL